MLVEIYQHVHSWFVHIMEYNKKLMIIPLQSQTHLMKKHDFSLFSKITLLTIQWLKLKSIWAVSVQIIWWVTGYYFYVVYIIIKSTIKSFLYCSYFYWWQCTRSSLSILCWNAILGDNSMNSSIVWNVTEFTYVHYWICCNCCL